MCGIAGIFAYHYAASPVDRTELLRIRDWMVARGPDGSGAWYAADDRIALAHRRLAIIDASDAGAQPMTSADGSLVVSFNGEIYNYRELRQRLEQKGHVFRSVSDTEVLLHLYAEKGEKMVEDLRGMFAFSLWDGNRRALLLARDPYGIKPLYYADDGWSLRFASQVKALLAGGAVSKETDPAGEVGFHLFGSVPEPFTTVASIRALPAGTTMLVDRIGPREPHRLFSIAEAFCAAEGSQAPDKNTVQAELLDSVRHHLVADVPVGIFLSAGIDSGALLGLMRDSGQSDIQAVTLGFEEFQDTVNDEVPLAAEVARKYGARHLTRIVTSKEFETDLPRIIAAMDQPSIDGFNTWFVSKAAKEQGLKVVLSGLGGDELFGGYPSFQQVPALARAMRWPSRIPVLPRTIRSLAVAGNLVALGMQPKAAGLVEYGGSLEGAYLLRRGLFMPWELPKILGHDIATEGLRRLAPLHHLACDLDPRPHTGFAQVGVLEACHYMRNQLLRDTDWASMAHSLEVRVPLVDPVLLCASAPHTLALAAVGVSGKTLLAASPTQPLPQGVIDRPKIGFSTPIARWLEQALLGNRAPQGKKGASTRANQVRRLAKTISAAITSSGTPTLEQLHCTS